MNIARISYLKVVGFLCLGLAFAGDARAQVETNSPAAEVPVQPTETSLSNETLRLFLQLQEKIHESQLAVEQIRRDSDAAAAKSADALAARLENIERSLATHREAMQGANNFMLTALFVFAGFAFIGIVLTAFFQWRTVSRLVEFSGAVPALRPAGLLSAGAVGGEPHLVTAGQVEPANSRLAGVIDRLEKRILELEHASHPPLNEVTNGKIGDDAGVPAPPGNGSGGAEPFANAAEPPHSGQIKLLLERGQALLNQSQTEEAIQCFDGALILDPHNTEALVKKGIALEKLRKLPEAIECYDRAIAEDGSLTIAYLYKGGLYNRMERFSEAVECYEQALRTQEKRAA